MLREFKFMVAQSICTHYSSLSGQPDIFLGAGTLKKQGAKKQGHCCQKREEAAWPFLFLNNNDPVFLHPAFFRSIFWT